MGNGERSNDPAPDVIDGWFDLLDDEAATTAPRPAPRPNASPAQGVNLSALNDISNKVTPVMLSPVHHLLPPIEPSQPSSEPRDVWETDVGNELESFFSVPAANSPARAERKSEPDPLPPLMELSDADGEEFLDFGDSSPNLSAAATLGSVPRDSRVQPSPPPPSLDLDDTGPSAVVEFEPSPPPAPMPQRANPSPPAFAPLTSEAGTARLPDPAGVPTSTPVSTALLNPRLSTPAEPMTSGGDDFDLSDFDRWGREEEEVTPAAGFQVFTASPVFASPPSADDFADELTVPRMPDSRALAMSAGGRPPAETPTVVPSGHVSERPEAPTARAPNFTPPPPPGSWSDSTPPSPSNTATRSSPPLAPGATPWNRPASPSRRPVAATGSEMPTPVRPPPLPHVHAAQTAPPPQAPSFTTPPQSVAAVPSHAESPTPPRPMPAVALTPPKPTLATAATPPQAMAPPRAPAPAPEAPLVPLRKLLPAQEMHERFDLGDFAGALNTAETILEVDPDDRDATHIAEVCRAKLRAIYVGRLGSLEQVPVLAVSPAEFRWLNLDHRAGFLLSLIDGVSTLEDIVDVSAMPQLEALRTLYQLNTQQIITLRKR